jgi:rhamnogalacturonyl hydrolase YesR
MKKMMILCAALAAMTAAAQPSNLPAASAPAKAAPSDESKAVLSIMKRVADWQLAAAPAQTSTNDWIYGALYTGMMALSRISDTPTYHDAMVTMGSHFAWKPARRAYHADDYCVAQTYLELYLQDRNPAMLEPTKQQFDGILAKPSTNGLDIKVKGSDKRWCWCDSLFMAPPAWIRLYAATGNTNYLEFMDREWWATSDYLYDTEEHLYFRDSTFFAKREANGKKVYWSRGNGWVLAGLARVLEYMPADYPHRKKYEQQFREMAARIAGLQQLDGLWRPSLLDTVAYPQKETSGSGFYTYGIAWGVNHGLLERAAFEPVARKGWKALTECVSAEGKLEHVQPVGLDPKKFDPTHSEPFGVGAFLLAGSEMYRLSSAPAR